ncbi:MAG: DUF1566 domain-containing protein [Bacteroidetes bacterium]|nr:DUF1566 domain-containing protein [Bacteroidota bacterium]
MKKSLFIFFIFVVVCAASGYSIFKTMLRLPDTGQTGNYTSTFGEDSDYLINVPSFINNSSSIVVDTVTGLMWQRIDGGEMTYENAKIYCDTLTLGGYTNWRLPDCHELFSILNHNRTNPAIDTLYFTKTLAEYWWSSQRQANDTTKVWVTNAGGGVGNHLKTETISAGGTKRFHVRAVRDATAPISIPQRFSNNGNGTTTDLVTGLMWQQVPFADSLTWEQALTNSENLNFAGYSDWRLPNVKELQSINDETLINPSVNQTFFSGVSVKKYWSSTSLPNQTTKAWYLDTQFGITTYDFKTRAFYVICVRTANTTIGINQNGQQNFTREYKLYQNYPNPFNPVTNIFYFVPKSDYVTLKIFDLSGKEVSTLLNEFINAGYHTIEVDGSLLASGVYYYSLSTSAGNFNETKKMVLIK